MHAPPQQAPGWPVAACLLVYAALLYGQAATASLHDGYWPGIERLRWLASPGWLLLALLGGAWLSRSARWACTATRVAAGACALCALLLIWLLLGPSASAAGTTASAWQMPQARSLGSVLHTALFTPSFSNRSWLHTAGSALWAALAWALAARLRRRAQAARPPQPGGGA